jgi:hypothetical protein
MNEPEASTETSPPIFIPHQEFRSGLPQGRFHVIVNPGLAQKYVRHRLFVVGISLPLLGIGAALAVSGHPWVGLLMVAAGFLLPRVIKAHAAKILLYLAQQESRTYLEAMEYGILEVRHR